MTNERLDELREKVSSRLEDLKSRVDKMEWIARNCEENSEDIADMTKEKLEIADIKLRRSNFGELVKDAKEIAEIISHYSAYEPEYCGNPFPRICDRTMTAEVFEEGLRIALRYCSPKSGEYDFIAGVLQEHRETPYVLNHSV